MKLHFTYVNNKTNKKIQKAKMKKIKFLSLFFIALSAMMFTSCLDDDDDDNTLSPQQIADCYNMTKGVRNGKMVYQLRSTDGKLVDKNDSIDFNWEITSDTTMTFHNFPTSALASVINDPELMNAVAAVKTPVELKAYIGYVKYSPVQWLINPIGATISNVQYKNATHTVHIAFYGNSNWSFGQCVSSAMNTKQQIQIVAGAVYLDDSKTPVTDGIVQIGNQRAKAFQFFEK